MLKYRLILILFLSAFIYRVLAIDYYVDFNNGDDQLTGTSQTLAWKHCPGDANALGWPDAITLQPGDRVLFRGGIEYCGEIRIKHDGAEENPIIYKGDGWGSSKAIINGADAFNANWTRCASAAECRGNSLYENIYYADAPEGFDFFDGFYEDNNFLWFSQDPNPDERFNYDNIQYFYDIPLGRPFTLTSLTDSGYFTQTDPNYWNGSYLLVWHIPNVTTPQGITSFNPASYTIGFDEIGGGGIYDDRGSYFSILNHPALIDQAGEYALDTTLNRIYLWPPNSDDPNNHTYSCQERLAGIIYNHRKNLIIEGFEVCNSVMGIRSETEDSKNVIIRNNTVKNLRSNNWYSIQINGSNITVENNRVEDCMRSIGILAAGDSIIIRNNDVKNTSRQGIWFMGVHHGSIINNIVTDVRGTHSNSISAYLYNEDILIAGNQVYNCNIGLTFEGDNDLPELYINLNVYNNYFEPACHGWGNARGIKVINNTCRNGFFFSDTDTITTSINNIVHAGGDGEFNRNNLFTDLGWWQMERYGWSLQPGEIDWSERDINEVYNDIETNDFTLKEGSPAIDSGINAIDYLPVDLFPEYNFYQDVFGNPRFQGTSWDIGAHEYGSGNSNLQTNCSIGDDKIQVYPVPAENILTIDYDENCSAYLYNTAGECLIKSDYKYIDVGNLVRGVYILNIVTSEGECPVKVLKN